MDGLPPEDMNSDNPAGFLRCSVSVLLWERSSLVPGAPVRQRSVRGSALATNSGVFLCQLGSVDLQENLGRGSGTGELGQHEKPLPIVLLDVPVFKRC